MYDISDENIPAHSSDVTLTVTDGDSYAQKFNVYFVLTNAYPTDNLCHCILFPSPSRPTTVCGAVSIPIKSPVAKLTIVEKANSYYVEYCVTAQENFVTKMLNSAFSKLDNELIMIQKRHLNMA